MLGPWERRVRSCAHDCRGVFSNGFRPLLLYFLGECQTIVQIPLLHCLLLGSSGLVMQGQALFYFPEHSISHSFVSGLFAHGRILAAGLRSTALEYYTANNERPSC